MKLSFEPKENISWLDYYILSKVKIHDLLFCRKLFKNWWDVVFFRAGLKKRIILETRNNEKVVINNSNEYKKFCEEFWNGNKIFQNFFNKTLKLNINITKKLIKINK